MQLPAHRALVLSGLLEEASCTDSVTRVVYFVMNMNRTFCDKNHLLCYAFCDESHIILFYADFKCSIVEVCGPRLWNSCRIGALSSASIEETEELYLL